MVSLAGTGSDLVRVYTGGTFDLFHSGHARFLERCASFGPVTVSLNTDEFIEEFKGSAPIMNFEERRTVVASCRYVHKVVTNLHGADSKPAIQLAQPEIIVIGSDWLRRDYLTQMGLDVDWLDRQGIGIAYIPYTQGISTTELKRRFRESM